MQHFRTYMSKINSLIEKDKGKKKVKTGGLLSPSAQMNKQEDKQQDAMAIVAEFVKGIRAAREGFNK